MLELLSKLKRKIWKEKKLNLSRKIQLLFFFHLNQHQTPYSFLVEELSYYPLLELLDSLEVPVVINISAPLLKSLLFKKSPLIDLVRKMKFKRRLELVSSSWAENILKVTPDRDLKIESVISHRKFLEDVFGRQERWGFWSSERVWNEEQLEFLEKEGFSYSFVENTILETNFKTKFLVPFWVEKGNEFLILPDIKEFKWAVNNYVNGDGDNFEEINSLFSLTRDKTDFFSFCEDAEMFRVWSMERHGRDKMEEDYQNLYSLLISLKSNPLIEFVLPSDYWNNLSLNKNTPAISRSKIKLSGWANWMDISCQNKDQFFWEEGYQNWGDFQKNSPKISKYKKIFQKYWNEIKKRREILRSENFSETRHLELKSLWEELKKILLSHLWEFGCVGIGGDDYPLWTGVSYLDELFFLWDFLKKDEKSSYEKGREVYFLKDENFVWGISLKTGSIIHFWDRKNFILGRDYHFHFYEEKTEDLFKEEIKLNPGENLWKWFDSSKIIDDFSYQRKPFILNRFILKFYYQKDGNFYPLMVDNWKQLSNGLYLRVYLPKNYGKVEIFYLLENGFKIQVKLSSLKLLWVKFSFSEEPLEFSNGYKSKSDEIRIETKNDKKVMKIKFETNREIYLEKDFFSYNYLFPLEFSQEKIYFISL